jgi:hypothetical protein
MGNDQVVGDSGDVHSEPGQQLDGVARMPTVRP